MTALPTWLLGRNCTAAITPQSIASDGTLTAGSQQTLVGQLDSITIDQTEELEEISPMDIRQKNYVIVASESAFELTEILKSNGTNILAAVGANSDVAYFSLTRGGQSWGFYGVVASYREEIRKGKSTGVLRLQQVYISGGNPTYA